MTTTDWPDRIDVAVNRWWRLAIDHAEPSLRDDAAQSCWVALLEGSVREEHWHLDLKRAIQDAVSVQVRGYGRGARRPWGASEVTPYLRDKCPAIEHTVYLRLAIEHFWRGLDNSHKLVLYGLCCVPNPLSGSRMDGIPQTWADQWGLSKRLIGRRMQSIRQRLRKALEGER